MRAIAFILLLVAPGAQTAARVHLALAARAFTPGELVVVTITTPADATAVAVRALGAETPAYRVSQTRWESLVGLDLDRKPGPYEVTADVRRGPDLIGTVARPLVVHPRQFPTRHLSVNPDFVTPPKAVEQRIEEEGRLLRDAYAHSSPERLWRQPFVRPVPGAANSQFGTRSVFNGEPRNPHGGADLLSGAGTPIKAPNAGRVAIARDMYFSGNTVVIDHGLGVLSLLAHMSRIDVKEGELVRAGQPVGLVGATGRVTGPHLHWALRVGDARVDPMSALELLGTRSDAQTRRR